jgi:hypothetical protein
VIDIRLGEDIEDRLVPYMKNWEKVTSRISEIDNRILQTGNRTVKNKLHYALMHWDILAQTYTGGTFGMYLIKRAMTENIILNLVSSLEAFAHVINQLYDIQLDHRSVAIDHLGKGKHSDRRCLRCKLEDKNIQLASYLDNQLLRAPSPLDNWYESLVRYRHQIVHRTLFLLNQRIEGSFLPDDPHILEPQGKMYFDVEKNEPVIPNYTENREVKEYTLYLFKNVFKVLDDSYYYIFVNL